MDLIELQNGLRKLDEYYREKKTRRDVLLETKENLIERKKLVQEQIELLQQVKILLQESAAYAREQARQQIESMVTHALQYTFGPDLEFKVELVERRGQPEADFYVVSNYSGFEIKTEPQDARGGGVVDVISLALRISLLHASRPEIPGPLLMDEPGKHLSEQFAPNLARFLKVISDTGRQVIMVTHNEQLTEAADAVYEVNLEEGKSIVRFKAGFEENI
ncbi:ATPase [Desulfolucanica intricata]|uniref:ATPase n=1 Tax=Desulfolucanica intricata TaxID=1285191 RepID=UPI00082B2054|nr:ATPase [Desulfolucanica intricata]